MRLMLLNIYFCFISVLYGQNLVPPILKFDGLKENWVYISRDENFNDYYKSLSNTGFTPYALKFCRDILEDNQYIYILESSLTPSPFIGNDGFLLHKIEKNTGHKLWMHHNNFMSGNKHRELYWSNKINIDANGYIKLLGHKDLDTITFNLPKYNFYGNPIERTIDTTGKLIQIRVGNNLSRNPENVALSRYPIWGRSEAKHYHCLFQWEATDQYVENLNCYPLTNQFEIKDDSFFRVPFPSEISLDASFSSVYPKSYVQISEDTLLTLTMFGTTSDKESSPENVKLGWVAMDDDGMKLVKTVDITDDIFRPQDLSIFHSQVEIQKIDGYIVLSQIVAVSIPTIDAKFLSWILVYDSNGNLVSKPEWIFNKSKKYTNVKILKIQKNTIFVSVQMDDGTVMGSDILEIDMSNGSHRKIGNIVTNKVSTYQIGSIEQFEFLDDNNILVVLPMDIRHDNQSSTIRYYYNFKLNDVGILSSTQDLDFTRITYIITPNPSSDQITVTIPVIKNAVTLHITDQVGRSVWVQNISDTETVIDISGLASGMYFVSLVDVASGRQLGKVKKLVKVE